MKTQRDFHIVILFVLIVIGVGSFSRGFFSTKDVEVYANDGMPSTEELYKPLNFQHKEVAVEEPIKTPQPTTTPTKPKTDLEKLLNDLFGKDSKVMHAVLRAESGLNPKAKGWNCHYYRNDGSRYSAACRPEDRSRAWSVDCGIAQNNFVGQECPLYSLDTEWSVREAYRKWTTRGFSPWVAWKKGLHLPFMK